MRYWMEEHGWLQGSIVKQEDVVQLLSLTGDQGLVAAAANIALIVASGSCDVANCSDPIIEFSIARYIDCIDGNYSSNKNPRKLNCSLESSMSTPFCVALDAWEKISILKDQITPGISPDAGIKLSQNELFYYVEWLAGRYKRPAFPTEFDKRIDREWNKGKRRKAASKISEKVLGIYAKIYPDAEIKEDEKYIVDLLVLVVQDISSDELKDVNEHIGKYKEVLEAANMNVGDPKVLSESQVSIATFKQYKRFNLDELSYKLNHPLPPELGMS